MKSILVTARGLRLPMLATSTWDAINRAQALYPERRGFSARVQRPASPTAPAQAAA
jgi:hypothetical protein